VEIEWREVVGVVDGDIYSVVEIVPDAEAEIGDKKRYCVRFDGEDGLREDSEWSERDRALETSGVVQPPRIPDARFGTECREGGPVPGSGSGCLCKGHFFPEAL